MTLSYHPLFPLFKMNLAIFTLQHRGVLGKTTDRIINFGAKTLRKIIWRYQGGLSESFESKLVDSGDHTWQTWSLWRWWRFEAVPRSGCECLAVKAPEVRVR